MLLASGIGTSFACRGAVLALGDTPGEAAHRGGDLIGAVASRFGPTVRDPAFTSLRPKLVRAALVPSRAFEDPSLWTTDSGSSRCVTFTGERRDGRYWMGVTTAARVPDEPGRYRGLVRLASLGPHEYQWSVREELAVGTVTVDALTDGLTALLAAVETAPESDLRSRLRQALPRTASAVGRLFHLDTLEASARADGATRLRLETRLDPEKISAERPRYARFLRKHISPIRLRATAVDETGARWWELDFRENRLALSLRILGGHLTPLDGPQRGMPTRFDVAIDLTSRAGWFRVGVRGLEISTSLVSRPRERAFVARFQEEPQWVLPFLVQPLLRASLRRPFLGEGAVLEGAVRGSVDGQMLLVRDYSVILQESWIIRWMGGFLGSAVSDFRAGAEAEADQFVAEALRALRADVVLLAHEEARAAGGRLVPSN